MPTASGFGRHRVVHPPEASAALEWVLSAIADSGAEPWVHSCAAGTPLGLLRGAGARGLAVDLAQLSAEDHDDLGQALEAGETVALGVLPTIEPADPGDDARLAERVLRWLDMLGFDPEEVGDRLVVSPACGLAGGSADWARRALTLTRATAQALTHG